jgi:hypothetical protein
MVDEEFENDCGEESFDASGAYNELKEMYSKLMSSSQHILDQNAFSMDQIDIQGESNDNDECNEKNIDNDDEDNDFVDVGATFSQTFSLLQSIQKELKMGQNELHNDPYSSSPTITSPSPQNYQSPPDPDDDWEYYNSHETNIKSIRDGLDQNALKSAEELFTARTLQGWIFSSHSCPNCEQILLFPPSSSVTPEDITEDIVELYNNTLNYSTFPQKGAKTKQLLVSNIDVDSCEFIRAACTYCGWFCLTDDDGPVMTLQHDCCVVANDVKIVSMTAHLDEHTNTPVVQNGSHNTPVNDNNTESEWSLRIKDAMNRVISDQVSTSVDKSQEFSSFGDDFDEKDFDFYNFDNLEETKNLLQSAELQKKLDKRAELSSQLAKSMSAGKLLLDEYCPDCMVPLVGTLSDAQFSKLSTKQHNEAVSGGNSQGMKLLIDEYPTMPKECIYCKSTWNMDKIQSVQIEQNNEKKNEKLKYPLPPPRPISTINNSGINIGSLSSLNQSNSATPQPSSQAQAGPKLQLSSPQQQQSKQQPPQIPPRRELQPQQACISTAKQRDRNMFSTTINALFDQLEILTTNLTILNDKIRIGLENGGEADSKLVKKSIKSVKAIEACCKSLKQLGYEP